MKQKMKVKVICFMMAFILVIQTFIGSSGQMIAKASSALGTEENISQQNLQNLNGINVASGSAIDVNVNQWQIPDYGTGFTVDPETGMTIIQSEDDPDYYRDNYWNTLDKNKLPGTTVLASEEVNVVSGSSIGVDGVWHGAKLDETNFISGVKLNQDASGQKSYFAFDDQIACFGAGISNISEDPTREVHTIIDNIKFDDNAKDKLVLRYSTKTISAWINSTFCPLGNTYSFQDNPGNLSSNKHWALSLPYGSSTGIGYYFETNQTDSNFRFVENMDELNNKKTYLELWLNHGTAKNSGYSYYIFKNLKASEAVGTHRDYMKSNIASNIVNTKDIQAAYYKESNTVSANIWAEQGASVEYSAIDNFTVDSQASVMMRKQAGILEAAIAEPTGMGQGTIEMVIDTNGYEVVAKDENISIDLTTPGKIKLSIDVTGKNGETSKVSINTIPPALDGNLSEFSIVKGKSALIPIPEGF
jgi:hyaluronate lyase